MKKQITEKIEIPKGIEVTMDHNTVKVSFENKKAERTFNLTNIKLRKEGNELILESKKATKREGAMIGTVKAHLKNILKGMKESFVYKLAIEFVHFPMTVEHDKDKNQIVIKNFLGEKKPRVCDVIPEVEIKVDKKEIEVSSHNRELAGQMAANLEKLTKVRKKDKRKFQDGIYLVEKCGRKI